MEITQEILDQVLKQTRHHLENAKKTIENVDDNYIKDVAYEVFKGVVGSDNIDVDARLKVCNYVISNIAAGPYEIEYIYDGYKTLTSYAPSSSGTTITIDKAIMLHRNAIIISISISLVFFVPNYARFIIYILIF